MCTPAARRGPLCPGEPSYRFPALWALALLLWAGAGRPSPAADPEPITTTKQLRDLPLDAARAGRPVKLQGVVTLSDARQAVAYVQDGGGGALVRFGRDEAAPTVGQRVEVAGITFTFNDRAAVARGKFTRLGTGQLPEPAARSAPQALSGADTFLFVEVRGVVRRVSVETDGRPAVTLGAGADVVTVSVRGDDAGPARPLPAVGARVAVRGVIHPLGDIRDGPRAALRVNAAADITVDAAGPPDPFALAAESVARLPAADDRQRLIRGTVVGEPTEAEADVRDETGVVRVSNPDGLPPLQAGDRVDAVGFAAGKTLGYARVRVRDAQDAANPGGRPFLHSAADVRRLTRAEADLGLSVRLRATVTHVGAIYNDFFLQDATGAVYVTELADKPAIKPGDVVVVRGVSSAGGFSPQIDQARVTVLRAGVLPPPERVAPADIASGRLDAHWVEMEGVVLRLTAGDRYSRLRIATGLGPVNFRLPRWEKLDAFVDRRVRVRGVYLASYREGTQLQGFEVMAPSAAFLTSLDAAPPDPFDANVRAAGRLLDYDPLHEPGRRVRVGGQVTAVAGADGFFLQDATGGLFVQVRDAATRPARGDFVEASGYIESNALNLAMREAMVRAGPEYAAAEPEPVTARKLMDTVVRPGLAGAGRAAPANKLLRLRGRFVGLIGRDERVALELQDGAVLFHAVFPAGVDSSDLPDIPPDSLVEVVGVCKLQGDPELGVQGFVVILRDLSDVAVAERPPWWTGDRAQRAAFAALALLVLAVAGLAYLRHRLRRQGRQIRVRLSRELQMEARYRDLVERATDLIFTLDSRGLITGWNRAGEALMGLPRDRLVGRPLIEFLAGGPATDVSALYAESPVTVPLTLRTAKQLLITLEVSARPVLENGIPVGLEAIARDVTSRNRLEGRMREVAKMQAVGQLAGGIAHDFNNLLTVINGNCDLLIRMAAPGTEQRELLDEVKTAGLQAASVTRQLLAFGRQTVIAPKTLNLNQLITNLTRVLKRLVGEHTQLKFQPDDLLEHVRVDPGTLEQAILNLVVNARDAMPAGGTLTVRTNNIPGGWVRLEVADTGHGMTDEVKARIFEPYFTTKPIGHGTGLGLAMVAGFMEQSGGRIVVHSEPGVGATFQLEFEAVTPESSFGSTPVETTPTVEHVHGATILLVEDEPSVQLLEKRILETGKYKVMVASSAEEALDLLTDYGGPLDMLVTDVVMPGKNGRELAEEIRRWRPELKVLFLSGYMPDEVLREGVEADAAQFLQKPFTPSDLLKTVRRILTNSDVPVTPPK